MKLEDIMSVLASIEENPPISNNDGELDTGVIKFFDNEISRLLSGGNVTRAAALLDGHMQLGKFEPVPVDGRDWSLNPFADRNWLWRYHQLEFTRDLLRASAESEDAAYDEAALAWAESWIGANLHSIPESPMAWHDHATALRLHYLLIIWYKFRKGGRSEDCNGLELALVAHCRLLCEDDFYSTRTNHGFDQMYILLLAGSVLTHFEESSKWIDIATRRLVDEIQFAFSKNGIHVENSPAYHQSMLVRVMRARDAFGCLGIEVELNFYRLIENGIKFLAWITHPDGTIPLIGDTTVTPVIGYLSDLHDSPASELLRCSASGGEEGIVPQDNHAFFTEDGWVVFRSHIRDGADFKDSIHLIMKSAFFSTYHRHDDDTSIVLKAFGSDWLLDSGMYNYHEEDQKRLFVRSVYGHNLMVLEGISTHRDVERGRQSTKMWIDSEDDRTIVHASTEMYEGYRLQRSIERISESRFRIEDTITTLDDGGVQPDGVHIRFHIPAGRIVEVDGGSVCISDDLGHSMVLKIHSPVAEIILQSGVVAGEVQSWVSRNYGVGEDAQVIRFQLPEGEFQSVIELELLEGNSDE